MKLLVFSLLLLFLARGSQPTSSDRFFITAPRVFRVGVNEKVFVQMGGVHLNTLVTLYLETEMDGIVSEQKTVECSRENEMKEVDLMIDEEMMSRLHRNTGRLPSYLNLVATSSSFGDRKSTKVLVSRRRGHIFIQTDQPIYTPMQPVRYRIFTLDPTLRPLEQGIEIEVYNAAGNRVMKDMRIAEGGIYKNYFNIPSVSKMGTWRITAHFRGEEASAASVEFKVEKFVLPSFEVNIVPRENFILLGTEQFMFTISALYSYGEQVAGAYHCQLGVAEKGSSPDLKINSIFMKQMKLTGSVSGTAQVSFQVSDLDTQLQRQMNRTLVQIQQTGSRIYLGVFVTNVKSGEIQNANIYLPVVSHKYVIDLSRTRSHFVPGFPLNVVAYLRFPDGSPAAGVPINIRALPSQQQRSVTTNQEGAAFDVFNIPNAAEITVEVSTEGLQHTKVIQCASSPSGSYLYMNVNNRINSVGDTLTIDFNTFGAPTSGYIYYMILSRGTLVDKGWETIGTRVRLNLLIKANMVPSFRVIGYYFDQSGNIIADSAWVDVTDECEINVKVETKDIPRPGRQSVLEFDLHGQKSKVALLAVDKAIYALHANNKLTGKKVFSTMQSNDLGCTYSGGPDPAAVLTQAGLSFFTHSQDKGAEAFRCNSQSVRHRRSLDLHEEMMAMASNFTDEELQECCKRGFSPTPMKLTCEEREQRVALLEKSPMCIKVFSKCCLEGARLLQKKMREEAQKGFGRTEELNEIEDFLLNEAAGQYLRRYFPPSFDFTEFDINGKGSHTLSLPDSITTWEIQVVTLSATTGFCVVEPHELRVFKDVFVSLRLPYSVRRHEQLAISPVIYNYGHSSLRVAVNMEQTEGLCAPGSATTTSHVTINLEPQSSQFVTFSVVPMVTGQIPIRIRLLALDFDSTIGIDAIEKTLNVLTEGVEKRDEETRVFSLDGRRDNTFTIDGSLPDDTVPDSISNIFVSAEENSFGSSHAKNLLSPDKVNNLIVLPTGCLEQTMTKLAPTASAIRYLDLSDQWFTLPMGSRDKALDNLERGYFRIFTKKKENGSYGVWKKTPYSNWMTALIVKVISMIAERQQTVVGEQGRRGRLVPLSEIKHSVGYLLSIQQSDGSFGDPNPVLHRDVMVGEDRKASMTAFVTIALYKSIPLLDNQRPEAEATISRATTYLQSLVHNLQHPYAVAITAYCLAACQPIGTDHSSTWAKLVALATQGQNGTYLWTNDASQAYQKRSDALTVDATSYALMAAVQLGKNEMADKIARWLTTQENYLGGFKSSQDTLNALEALAEYELRRPAIPETRMEAQFTAQGRREIVKLVLERKGDKVETNLKKLAGDKINVKLSGKGSVKLKFLKAFHLLEPKGSCDKVSINVTVKGKVQYTQSIIEDYNYYDDSDYANDGPPETETSRAAIEWFAARTRRDLESKSDGKEKVTYTVCVSHSVDRNLTGMGIADITLLSGFEAVTAHLDQLKALPERYISHYEISNGRVLLYFNELIKSEECIEFDATQEVAVDLLQPAPAVFYDYYEPDVKCMVFYSAPRRSKKVVTLCSDDVCQCAERPCHKMKNTFINAGRMLTKQDRYDHACFSPTVDYAYIVKVTDVSEKSNFELYTATVMNMLKLHGDTQVEENSVRVFAKRRQCKGQLEVGSQYLIMGKDGSTRDSEGRMQYLLEYNTWVEKNPSAEDCARSARRAACRGFNAFTREYKMNGCRQ